MVDSLNHTGNINLQRVIFDLESQQSECFLGKRSASMKYNTALQTHKMRITHVTLEETHYYELYRNKILLGHLDV